MTEGAVPGRPRRAAPRRRATRSSRWWPKPTTPDGEVLRGRHADAGRADRRASPRAIRAGKLFPVFCASGLRNIGVQPLADALVTYVPSPADRPFAGHERRRARPATRAGRRQGAARALGLEDDRRSVRRPHHAVPRRLGRAEGGHDRAQPHARRSPSASATCSLLQGKTQTHVPELHAGDLGAVAKLKDTHTERHARRQGAPDSPSPPIDVPRAGARLRHRAEEPRRRGQDRPGDAAAAGRGPVDRLHARSADARAAARRARASCTSR